MFSERFLQSLLLETAHVLKPNQFLSESSFIVCFFFFFQVDHSVGDAEELILSLTIHSEVDRYCHMQPSNRLE